MDAWINSLCESMLRYVGQTVTIFTTSGGISGSGFTGVLIAVDCNTVKLLADVGAPPACPLGSACGAPGYGGCQGGGGGHGHGGYGNGGTGNGYGNGGGGAFGPFYGNPLGAIAVIPTRAIAAFTHNAI